MTNSHEDNTLEALKLQAEIESKDVWVLGYKEYQDRYEVQCFDQKNLFHKTIYWKTS